MGRSVALAAVVVASLVGLAAVVLAFTPLFDSVCMNPALIYDSGLGDQFHHGDRPCLRFDGPGVLGLEIDRFSDRLVEAGVTDRRLFDLRYEIDQLIRARESRMHARDEVEERLDGAAQTNASVRLLVALKRSRLRHRLDPIINHPVGVPGAAVMTPQEHAVIDAALSRNPELFTREALIAVAVQVRPRETQKKLDALAAFVTEKGVLDEDALPKELLEDAWGGAVRVSHEGGEVKFTSLGADGMLGGKNENADLSAVATVTQVVGDPSHLGPPPPSVELPRSTLDDVLQNMAQFAKDARLVPSAADGRPIGYKIYAIRKGSLYDTVGLANGDVITGLNGYQLSSPDKALEIYTKIKDADHVTVSVRRQGRPYDVHILLK
jgi:general secretion pathway protein C